MLMMKTMVNGVLGAELQPEELLLETVEAPWEEVGGEESSGEGVEVGSPLYPGELAPKRMRDEHGMRPEVRKVEADNSRREGAGGRVELLGRGQATASGACQGSA